MKKLALAITLLLTLAGCADLDELFASSSYDDEANVQERKKYESFAYEQMAPNAPPPARWEEKGNPPRNAPDEYTWRNGHWEYVDSQGGFRWLPGYWMHKPAFTASWRQDMWLQRTYGWAFVPGAWE